MDEYIKREAAIKAIYESDHFSVRECFGWRAREIEEVLRAVPATPVPQMMAEYIKRETVINHLDACMDTIWKPEIVALKCFVEGIPAADVAPVRHGKWMPFHAEFAGDIQYCSVCEIGFADRTSFCPHCGAVMDGWRVEGEEND